MAYDLEEQEQIAELKSWWREYGNYVMVGVAACALSFAALQGWRFYKQSQATGAVMLYEQMDQAERAGDRKKVRDIAAQITAKYGATTYGAYAALSAARAAAEAADLPGAKTQLQWVIDNAKEEEVRDIARLRLGGVLLDEKNYADALKLTEAKPVESMAGLYADLRGDILLAQGKKVEARGAYQLALDKSEPSSGYRVAIQLKLDSLGEAR
jgi:predicted negative regulator of RcsB-dependent stress response